MALFFIPNAVWEIMSGWTYRLIFLFIWVVLFAGMFYLPIAAVPGNDIGFQTRLFSCSDYIILLTFSGLTALILAMQVKVFSLTRHTHIASATTGALGGFVSALFGTATCTLCVGAFISLLGAGAATFLVMHRIAITSIAGAFVLLSLHLSSRRLVNGCGSCTVTGSIVNKI